MLSATLQGLDAFDALADAMDAELVGIVERTAETAASIARADHPYTDRTNRLTQSIEALPAVRAPDGVARGGVAAGEDYAEHVEKKPGYAYLEPALEASRPFAEEDLAATAVQAARRAGWEHG